MADTAIYHCQQAAEKAVKGFLVLHDQDFEKTHNIRFLVTLAIPFESEFSSCLEAAKLLTPYSGMFRYPDEREVDWTAHPATTGLGPAGRAEPHQRLLASVLLRHPSHAHATAHAAYFAASRTLDCPLGRLSGAAGRWPAKSERVVERFSTFG